MKAFNGFALSITMIVAMTTAARVFGQGTAAPAVAPAPTASVVPPVIASPVGKKRKGKTETRTVVATVGFPSSVKVSFQPGPTSMVGDNKILDLEQPQPGKQEITIQPKKAGITKVIVRDMAGENALELKVIVRAKDLSPLTSELRDLLKDIEGVKIRPLGDKADKVAVMGDLLIVSDYERVKQIVDAFNTGEETLIVNLTRMDKRALKILAKKMEEDIRVNGKMTGVAARVVGNERIFLEGYVDSSGQPEKAYQIAASYFPQELTNYLEKAGEVKKKPTGFPILVNMIEVRPPDPASAEQRPEKMVKIITQFVEVRNNYLRSMGFKWAPSFAEPNSVNIGLEKKGGFQVWPANPADAAGGSDTNLADYPFKLIAVVSNLFPRLNFARSNGFARIVDQAEIIVENGQPATLHKTQNRTLLVPTTTAAGQPNSNVFTYKSGLQSVIKPSIVGSQEPFSVKLDVDLTMSFDNGSNNTDDNIIRTKINVKSGQSAAIGGVVRSSQLRDINKTPSSDNVIFNLSRSKDFQNNKSQFVVFITPYVVEDSNLGVDRVREKFNLRAPGSVPPSEEKKPEKSKTGGSPKNPNDGDMVDADDVENAGGKK